jgi:glycosyltransferase involved in cell wall biosynthesis
MSQDAKGLPRNAGPRPVERSTPAVEVLVSAYNGAKYISTQLESILSQDYENITVRVRDDGSSDGTREILEDYARDHGVLVHFGDNIGVGQSFLTLLGLSSPHADYLSFCDQDDVWLPHKISRAVAALELLRGQEAPVLYCARVKITDESLIELGLSPLPRRAPTFANALIENIAIGCTVVLNRRGRELLVQKFPSLPVSHDRWAYQVVSAFGKVIYDPDPMLLYRQHGDNATGMGANSLQRLRRKVMRQLRLTRNERVILKHAEELRRVFGSSMPTEEREVLDSLLDSQTHFLSRVSFCFNCPVYRQGFIDNIGFRVLYAVGRV